MNEALDRSLAFAPDWRSFSPSVSFQLDFPLASSAGALNVRLGGSTDRREVIMQSLGVTAAVQADLTPELAGRLASLGAWDIANVSKRTRRRLHWTLTHSGAVEREYRRFLGLLMLNPEKEYGMAGDVDELWHDHILDTQNYLTMCRQVVGAVVHHCPRDGERPTTGESAYDTGTYPDLARTYAGPVSRIWPKQGGDAAVARCCGHSLERLAD